MEKWHITPNIVEAKVFEDYKIYLKFETGEEKIYDMSKLIGENKMYIKLTNKNYFKDITILNDTLHWKDGEDVAPEILYHNSVPYNT